MAKKRRPKKRQRRQLARRRYLHQLERENARLRWQLRHLHELETILGIALDDVLFAQLERV